ncbi:uncharacterized protein [Oryza sativa Japonica Group]|nr:uncharacterized protein LOC4331579 [Oryza sativa Japonica Group]
MASTPAVMAPPPLKYRHCSNVDGLVSVEALRIIVETKACFVAVALALAYFLTASRHRLWSSSHLIKGFLFAVTQPVTRFLVSMFAMLLSMPFRNDLYLLWGILLLAGYEGVYTISGYGVSARLSDLAVHEFTRCSNIVVLGLYVRYYSHASQFRYPLWALWALMVAKFLERIVLFKNGNRKYGDGNTSRVADYMKHEHELSNTDAEAGGFSMEDYKYLIVGDSKLETTIVDGMTYEPKLTPPIRQTQEADDTVVVVTVDKVWTCKGELLKTDNRGDKLKDICLSFALCKLLRRKFAGVNASENERSKAQKLVFDGLIPDPERTFRVVRAELGFARDMSFTKYPILFSYGFPVVSVVLFAATLGVSLWIISSAIHHYRIPRKSTPNLVNGKNVDLIITFVIVFMVTAMDICEFFMHLFSDWTKVMVVSEYVRKRYVRCCLLDRILWLVCHGKLAETIGSSLGQFDLLNGAKKGYIPERIVRLYHMVRSFILLTDDKDYRIKKGKSLRPVPESVEKALCETLLSNRKQLTQGLRLLTRSKLQAESEELLTYCQLAEIETIVVWHVATCKLEQQSPHEPVESYQVATALSKYCAYLVFYNPKLLPVGNTSVRHTCKTLVRHDSSCDRSCGGDDCMIRKGEALAAALLKGRELNKSSKEPGMWTELAEFWSELLISLAPFGSVGAHEKGLGDGGEFITHLWALLYHAGIDAKYSWSSASTASGESGGRADVYPFQNGMDTVSHAVN